MNERTVIVALIASTFSVSALAVNFGSPAASARAAAPVTSPAAAPLVSTSAAVVGPQLAESFRVYKADGSTLIQQAALGANVLLGGVITLSDKDVISSGAGKCAYNVKYDEVSGVAAAGTTNRLYSNDRLIAQNTAISLVPGVVKTVWTQPYLVAGLNNVRVVVNADSPAPSTKWLRINVTGTCGAAATPVVAPAPAAPFAVAPVARHEESAPVKPQPVALRFAPGSSEWNNLHTSWGYSNYAVAQFKTAGYERYAELARLNAAMTLVINAKTVEQGAYNSLMTSWNTFVTEARFQALMRAVVPGTDKK